MSEPHIDPTIGQPHTNDAPVPPSPVQPAPATHASTPPPLGYESVFPAGGAASWARLTPMEQTLTIAGGAALLVLAISTLLTWVSISGGGGIFGAMNASASGTASGWGKFILLLSIAGLGATAYAVLVGQHVRLIRLACAAIGSFAALFLLVMLLRIPSAMNAAMGGPANGNAEANEFAAGMIASMGIKVSAGAGVYIGLLAGVAIAGAFAMLVSPRLTSGGLTPADKKELPIFIGGGALLGVIAAFVSG